MEPKEIQQLFKKYQEGKCTEAEKTLLEAWYLQFNEYEPDLSSSKISAIGKRIYPQLPGNHGSLIANALVLLAAVLLICILVSALLKLWLPEAKHMSKVYAKEIPPGTNNAILTLAGGHKINLSNAGNGKLVSLTGMQIIKTANGQISYQQTNESITAKTITNEITTPNGGEWQVSLSDGTKVWLNSATTLSYPASFIHSPSRIVELTGEAYFEVAKDRRHPFIVKSAGQQVEVLGTHFNIHAYADEASIKTTLEEGRVRISCSVGDHQTIMPGQQATLSKSSLTVGTADLEAVLAWKNGYFLFNDESIQNIMRQLARWYNVEVQYAPNISTSGLNGKISRYKNMNQVLKALEAMKIFHFKVEGRRVTVMP